MNQREKLIELIGDSLCCPKETDCADCEYKKYELCTETMIADYLINHGVVVLPCRCRECTHRRQADNWCGVKADFVSCNGYCNYAERR